MLQKSVQLDMLLFTFSFNIWIKIHLQVPTQLLLYVVDTSPCQLQIIPKITAEDSLKLSDIAVKSRACSLPHQ